VSPCRRPGSARPVSPPPPSYEVGERHQGQDTGAPKPQGPEETALASGAAPASKDADLGGAVRPAHAEEGRAIVASSAAPEAPTAGGEGDARWGKSPVFWPNLDGAEGGARFVLDDPSENYLWQGLDACGCASIEAINRASQLVSRDMFNLAQVRLPPTSKYFLFCFAILTPCTTSDSTGAQGHIPGEVSFSPPGKGCLGDL